jgi:hypothetical protein
MLRSVLAITAAAVLGLPGPGYAAKIKVWQHHTPAQYEKAQFKHSVVSSEGALRLSRRLKPLAGIDATHVWDVVEDKDGNLFVATGDEGKLFRVTPDGKASVVYTSDDSQVLCLALAPDGSVFAGTGPGGHIIKVDRQGVAKVFCDTNEAYVWCLAIEPGTQNLYAGTGSKGRVYRVTPAGKASIFYTTKQDHILCLCLGADGMLYAGTDKAGLAYRIDPQGKGFVLYSAPQAEIRTLQVAADGSVFAGTCSPMRRRGGSSTASTPSGSSLAAAVLPSSVVSAKTTDEQKSTEGASTSNAAASEGEPSGGGRSSAAPAPSNPSPGENSLYRIAPDGTVREIFREKALILCQLQQQGRIYLGTGMQGQLFEIDETTRERSEIARLDHGQILCMCRRQDGSIVVGTGDPGKLYVLQDRFAASGTVVSDVLDAKIISKWGSLRWRGETPAGTRITVATRSGNVAEPDDTWSEWSAEQADPQQGLVKSPTARFLQYRVTLATDDPAFTPVLRTLTLRYMTTNQAPEVTAIEVPDFDATNQDNPKKLRFKWNATDPNEDELTYSLFVRKDGWKEWVMLEETLEKKEFEWDTTTTPSGVYQLKIVASDRKDNPAEEALTGERLSEPFIVSHTPPAVTIQTSRIEDDRVVVEATVTDPLVRLTTASYAVNGKRWINIFPTDGLFDSKTEKFRFRTEALKPGTYVLVLRVRDAAGNTGSGDIVFTVPDSSEQP